VQSIKTAERLGLLTIEVQAFLFLLREETESAGCSARFFLTRPAFAWIIAQQEKSDD
jgi:hypothetical protein